MSEQFTASNEADAERIICKALEEGKRVKVDTEDSMKLTVIDNRRMIPQQTGN